MNNFDSGKNRLIDPPKQELQRDSTIREEISMHLLRMVTSGDIGQMGFGCPRRTHSYILGKPANEIEKDSWNQKK